MKKVRFFDSIILEALDRRTTSILASHRTIIKQTGYELQSQKDKIEKKINAEIELLIGTKNPALIEYKLKQLYVVEKEIAQRNTLIAWKNLLTIEISIFEEILIELRNILVIELNLLNKDALEIAEPYQLHNLIINDLSIYSKTLNNAWIQVKQAIRIESNLNLNPDQITEESRNELKKVKSVQIVMLRNKKEIMAMVNSNYLQEVTSILETYFMEMNDKINEVLKK
ncbi:hypothetical protein FEM33_14695 [Dyadobacter flavalbus]|uniref:Uncharacterized protein n=1 Tax=Dyadobacter flavalbus TaxID=2579942 RepID=A0A5M8QXU1_9BACT|nr:hypothetical protein [Dyadobacter flavalbus]KAA6439496.1 hypothetical protein FEM33_14695 [Dyadobacter flavalbus]